MRLPKKISMRVSILGIVLSLLVGISALIISINYFALNSVLIMAANSFLTSSSEKVGEQIGSYFKPLNSKVSTAFQLLHRGIIRSGYSGKFFEFLHSMIVDDENIYGIIWADVTGSFYWLSKIDNDTIFRQASLRSSNQTIEKIFDTKGRLLASKVLPHSGLDPRLRPWYRKPNLKNS